MTTANQTRPLYQIASEIRRDWKSVYFGAEPYLQALEDCDSIEDRVFQDSARDVVRYFLCNATKWRGEVARRVKAELKGLI
jgi:hypothetical protein